MTFLLWRIASDAPEWEAHDLTGKGAEATGGRWNRKGKPVVYCAGSISLAALETAVHIEADDLPMNRFVVCVEVPGHGRPPSLSSASNPPSASARRCTVCGCGNGTLSMPRPL